MPPAPGLHCGPRQALDPPLCVILLAQADAGRPRALLARVLGRSSVNAGRPHLPHWEISAPGQVSGAALRDWEDSPNGAACS